jgi:hypothetical protein
VENPFGSSPFEEASKEPLVSKTEVVKEAVELLGTAHQLESQAKLARKTKNWAWLMKIEGLARKLLSLLWDFTKKAMLLAVFNFVSELCTMILGAALASLSKYKTLGPAPASPGVNYNDPFSRHYGHTTVGW